MSKDSLTIVLLCTLFTSCGANKSGYVIEGEFILPNRNAYLCVKSENRVDTLASCTLNDGGYRFTGSTKEPIGAYITYGEDAQIDVLLENFTYDITTDVLNVISSDYVSDSKEQEIHNHYLSIERHYKIKLDDVRADYKTAMNNDDTLSISQTIELYSEITAEQRSMENEHIKKYPDSYSALLVTNRWKADLENIQFVQRMDMLGTKYSETEIYKNLIIKKNASQKISVGQTAPNFTMKNSNGESVSLYDIKAKIKMIDFWASWCGPCRALNPHVLELYNEYKSKGFEIISVSMDENTGDWLKAVKDDNMPWHQLSDLLAWKSQVAKDYNVEAIPHIVIMDENNMILGVKVRDAEIKAILKDYLK